MSRKESAFHPFYERLVAWVPGYVIGPLVLSIGLGLIFLGAHYAAGDAKIFRDWSWLLALLITSAMLALYYATYTLRVLLPQMSLRLALRRGGNDEDVSASDSIFMRPLNTTLSDRNFLYAAVFFGLLNCLMGYLFGLPSAGAAEKATLMFGFFLAGFVCGMGAWGIYGVTVMVAAFANKAGPSLDYNAPDHCGGVHFIGEGLVAFASVTLIVGVMISVYIHQFAWTHDELWWVVALQWAWIVFPYVLSLVVLVGPAVPLNEALRRYKVEAEAEQMRKSDAIQRQLDAEPLDSGKRKDLRDEFTHEQNIRQNLYAMGTWPHGLSANLKYFGIFAGNVVASISAVLGLLSKSAHS